MHYRLTTQRLMSQNVNKMKRMRKMGIVSNRYNPYNRNDVLII